MGQGDASNVVGAFDAKTGFGRLLDRASKGETIVITRHGRPVAKIVPFAGPVDQAQLEQTIRELGAFARGRSLGGLRIQDLIEEGRRF